MLFLLASVAFKASVAPFHFWTPDVYDGAPTVFTSFMATVVKAASFYAFFLLFSVKRPETAATIDWKLIFSLLILATLLVGNITAVYQLSVKRMLAYSSIAQAGFMMFALFGMNETAREGLVLYAASYCLATIGVFAVLLKMKDISFEGFNGLAKSQPLLAATTTIFLLSLAGIPLTVGFFAKYYMLLAAVQTGSYLWLVVVAVIFAAVSVYYYFRVIQAMYFKEGNAATISFNGGFKTGLVLLSAAIILLGVFPQLLLNWMYF
jgi:NADH-quinone oxidoreductase subunit N